MAQNEFVQLTIHKPRNLLFHRKFFSLVRLVFENQETYATAERLLTAIKLEAGWYEDGPVTAGGKISYIPKSISFEKMSEPEFQKFYEEALDAIVRLLPQFKAQDLLDAVSEYA